MNTQAENKVISASELLVQWREATSERDEKISKRLDNMFLGTIGIEEQLHYLREDTNMHLWFFNKLIETVADIESKALNK